jgi:hypothetical protein
MHYIIESVLVGLYCVIIYLIISPFFANSYMQLFITGFIKHFLSYYIGIHNWYCNNGYACKNRNNKIASNKLLTQDSILEGLLFLLVGLSIKHFFTKQIYTYFIIGIILHITFELFNIHNYYCRNYCITKL